MLPTVAARRVRFAAVLAVLLVSMGCSSLNRGASFRAITSEPSLRAIELITPAVVSEEGATTTFPAGKYKAAFEDDRGVYYEAPRKVLVDDIGVYGFDGGVYVMRGKSAPTHWYIIRPNGRRTMGKFKTSPTYKELR